ncbi:hypothetical protein [Haloarcula sp. CGMCC 1.6347]
MNVADADEYWMCDECFEQFDAAMYDEGDCPRPYCDNSPNTTLEDFC